LILKTDTGPKIALFMEAEGSLHAHKSPPPVPMPDKKWRTKRADVAVTLFARIRKVLSSNTGQDAATLTETFRGFLSSSMQILR
jgi:hypothetical protein